MAIRRFWLVTLVAVVGSLITTGYVGPLLTASAQSSSNTPKVSILLPNDSGFGDYEIQTKTTTNLSGSQWVTEFDKQLKFGDATSDIGVNGILYLDALKIGQLFEGKVNFVYYGLFTFPKKYPVNPGDSEIQYGAVVYLTKDSLIIVLIDLSQEGKIAAFVVVPRTDNTSPYSILTLDSLSAVFLILVELPTINTISTAPQPTLPVPGSTSDLKCPAGLTKVKDVNITTSSAQSIMRVQDSSGADLFEIGVDSPNLLTIQSLSKTQQVDATYVAEGERKTMLFFNKGKQTVLLKDGNKFVLIVSGDDKESCLIATPTKSGDNLKITGELQAK
ncbi:hypothetical protein HY229_05355 [Candidatus Acetothermia bacterium]|nr:hypothetical protein [Candidatus Acetothermia bacterium]MBI3643511.1 hypothetical protein [Candidatus Acetothermia bacterium]